MADIQYGHTRSAPGAFTGYKMSSDIYESEGSSPMCNPVIRGYFSDWFVYKPLAATSFPGFPSTMTSDFKPMIEANTKILEGNLPDLNELVYSFLEVKQGVDSSLKTYTPNPDWVGFAMVYDPWADLGKPKDIQWGVPSKEQLWINDHVGYFREKNDSGMKFDPSPSNSDFPYSWMNHGLMDAFGNYKLGQPDEPRKMFGIGGYGDQYVEGWKAALAHPDRFATSLLDLAQHYHIDGGVDLDWEPLSQVTDTLKSMGGSTKPLTDLVDAIKSEASSRGIDDYKVTFAICVDQKQIGDFNGLDQDQNNPAAYYGWANLMSHVDQLGIMGYDMHGAFDNPKTTGLHSILFPVAGDTSGFSDFGAINWLNGGEGIPFSQMILGIPAYARSVSGVTEKGLGVPFTGAYRGDIDDQEGPATGVTSYRWITKNILPQNIVEVLSTDPSGVATGSVPTGAYAYQDGVFHSFDTVNTAKHKAIYSTALGLGGNMIWSIESDGEGVYSLAKVLHDEWENYLHVNEIVCSMNNDSAVHSSSYCTSCA